jgi:hypothetical protein
MNQLILLSLPGLALLLGLTLVKASQQQRLRSHLVAFRLSFPRGLEAESVTAALAGIGGMLEPWWRRWLAPPFLSLETHASGSGIAHYLVIPEAWEQTAMNILEASLPSVRFEQVVPPEVKVRTAVEFRLSSQDRPLSIDAATLSSRLLANLHPLTSDVTVVVQWLVTPHGPVAPIKGPKPAGSGHQLLLSAQDSESVAALRKKVAEPLLLTTGRIGVRAPTGWRELKHLRQVETPWHETRAPGVHFMRRLQTDRSTDRPTDRSRRRRQNPLARRLRRQPTRCRWLRHPRCNQRPARVGRPLT